MSTFLEPVYLNETMMLNCAAYLFRGITTSIEVSSETSSAKKGELSLGMKFLTELLNISGGLEATSQSLQQEKLAKSYTTGGLHMSVIDELRSKNELVPFESMDKMTTSKNYIEIEAILKPLDFYSIIETLKTSTPLIVKVLHDFGYKLKPDFFNKQIKSELVQYDNLISKILDSVEKDYLKSSLLEMIMVDPNTNAQLGVVDIDVKGKDPLEVKAKLTDGKFYVIGKITRTINQGENIELLRRSFISTVIRMLSKLLSSNNNALLQFHTMIEIAKPYIEKICQLSIPGPAVRIMAMSVCI
ncbi:DUF6414 family protein [Desulfovibrio litoralis]|uniref:Uncharacterized protein n=1 Tax=Desulfovibrio litoralis DSM 11393 TaxID=1121455 RepID=A0A1M7T434_9BACT|nr:hypothetical protein [Desulfovibrio litoralis]SHN65437.1 hypothetical protein SAMN02745728_01527 [Desulfovibrio litoralis DSM 11393]